MKLCGMWMQVVGYVAPVARDAHSSSRATPSLGLAQDHVPKCQEPPYDQHIFHETAGEPPNVSSSLEGGTWSWWVHGCARWTPTARRREKGITGMSASIRKRRIGFQCHSWSNLDCILQQLHTVPFCTQVWGCWCQQEYVVSSRSTSTIMCSFTKQGSTWDRVGWEHVFIP